MYPTRPAPPRQTPPALAAIYRQMEVAGMLWSLTDSPATRDALDRLRDAQLVALVQIARAEGGAK